MQIDQQKVWDPDAASDEKSAGLLLQREVGGPGLPGIRKRMCDPVHACRRVLSRPWDQDPYLRTVINLMVFHKTSICQLVETSLCFQGVLHEELLKLKDHPAHQSAPTLVTLSAKKHRLEKCSTPIGKCVCYGLLH